ncbi:MAG: hypothetical protein Q7T57_00135 [Dehalococcoidales bacterium]|nr:hypothetical protein [Dehalococcoidales bacterium]
MPTIYLKKELYDAIVTQHKEPSKFVNELVEKALKEEKTKKQKGG